MNKPETTPPAYFHHLRDGTAKRAVTPPTAAADLETFVESAATVNTGFTDFEAALGGAIAALAAIYNVRGFRGDAGVRDAVPRHPAQP